MLGYPPAMLSYRLAPVPTSASASSTVMDKETRVRACPDIAEWIRLRFGCIRCEDAAVACLMCSRHRADRRDDFVWREYWRDIPYEMLAQVFTYEELVRIWFDESVVASKLSDHFEEHEPLLWKIKHSCWRYGWSDDYDGGAAFGNKTRGLPQGLQRGTRRGADENAYQHHPRFHLINVIPRP